MQFQLHLRVAVWLVKIIAAAKARRADKNGVVLDLCTLYCIQHNTSFRCHRSRACRRLNALSIDFSIASPLMRVSLSLSLPKVTGKEPR